MLIIDAAWTYRTPDGPVDIRQKGFRGARQVGGLVKGRRARIIPSPALPPSQGSGDKCRCRDVLVSPMRFAVVGFCSSREVQG